MDKPTKDEEKKPAKKVAKKVAPKPEPAAAPSDDHMSKVKGASHTELQKEVGDQTGKYVDVFGKQILRGEVAEIIQNKRRSAYDKLKREKNVQKRGGKIEALRKQLASKGITDFSYKKGEALEPQQLKALLDRSKKPKGKGFKQLVSQILSMAHKKVVDSVGGIKERIGKMREKKRSEATKKSTRREELIVPPNAKTTMRSRRDIRDKKN
jgi:hypothetical protein